MIRAMARAILTRSRAGRTLLAYFPTRVQLPGGSKEVPRIASSMFQAWSAYPDLVRESEEVYAVYNGGDILDVGAYHGWYSWLLASKASDGDTFVSVEPDARAASRLLLNLSELGRQFPGIITAMIPRAAGSGGDTLIHFPAGPAGHAQMMSMGNSGTNSTIRLDELVRLLGVTPAFVKIDVEGAEWFVLQGMEWTLQTYRPALMLELHPLWQPEGDTLTRITDLLISIGYSLREISSSAVTIRQIWQCPQPAQTEPR